MIEIFKTNIETIDDSKLVLRIFIENYPENTINFDLDDCYNILRAEGNNFNN